MRVFKTTWIIVAVTLSVLAVWVASVDAQDPSLVLADGGIQFPDGTVQSTAAAGGAPVEDTGQTQCYDTAGVERDCAGTGEDGEFQAGVQWPTPRFTDNGDGTVDDNLTGLIWLKDANCAGTSFDWQGALDWVADLNTLSIACTDYAAGSFTDWRLPNVKELASLIDYSQFDGALADGHPFVNIVLDPSPGYYWSSTSFQKNQIGAWGLLIGGGGIFTKLKNGDEGPGFAWPVRAGL